MLRRSVRLVSNHYYDNNGQPTISYKETLYRVFRRRRFRARHAWQEAAAIEANTNDDTINIMDGRGAPTVSRSKMFRLLFCSLMLCFGVIFAIPTLRGTFLDAGSSGTPISPTITNANSSAWCVEKLRQIKELQGELLRLKESADYMLPSANLRPNFALESLGARVVYEQSSESYQTPGAGWTLFGIPIKRPPVDHKIAITGDASLIPGRCWAFAGGRGHLSIKMSQQVAISHVTLGHISQNVSPTGSTSSAPKEFSVYGLQTLEDEGTHLGTFLYDQDRDRVQTFKVPDHQRGVFRFVKLQVESNWGHPDFTCLYTFRVHGELAD